MPELKISFSHYEKQGIYVCLQQQPDKTYCLEVIRVDTDNTLVTINLPKNCQLFTNYEGSSRE